MAAASRRASLKVRYDGPAAALRLTPGPKSAGRGVSAEFGSNTSTTPPAER